MNNIGLKEITRKVFYALSLVLAVILVLAKNFMPLAIGIIIVLWVFESSFKEKWQNLKNNKGVLLFIPLYFLYLAGLLYSDNIRYGLLDVLLKLPLLIFPLIYLSSELVKSPKFLVHVIYAFLLANFAATVISIFHSAVLYSSSHDIFDFYNNIIAYFIHPSYYAMHINFCIIAILWLLVKKDSFILKYKYAAFILIFYFSIFVFFLNSKLGILFLALIYLYIIYYFVMRRKYITTALLLAIVLASVLFIIRNFPGITNKIMSAKEVLSNYKEIENTSVDGTAERILIWRTSFEIISDNLIVGVGTGDVKDVLLSKYKEKGIEGAFNKRLNAHNQFLQTFIALGIFGFLLLVLMFSYSIFCSFKWRNSFYLFFILLVVINLFVESMFETQTGVSFYAFFNVLLFLEASKNRSGIKSIHQEKLL